MGLATGRPARSETPAAPANLPAPGESYFTTKTTPIPGGARITVDFLHRSLANKVSTSLIAILVDESGLQHNIELKKFEHMGQHSDTNYADTRTYEVSYDQINEELRKAAPHLNLKVGPGSKVYLFARWHLLTEKHPNYGLNSEMYSVETHGMGGNHVYGGLTRNGSITLPVPTDWQGPAIVAAPRPKGFTRGGRLQSLDVSNPVDESLSTEFPALRLGGKAGSRYENELKLHVDLHDMDRVKGKMLELVQDQAKLEALLGPGWRLAENKKYVGQPMIDVYLDNAHHDGAKKGMALRFRTGAGVTTLNYKPDDGVYQGGGTTSRIEYQLDGVASPEEIRAFMDSDHPMNALQIIREKFPGAVPSDFTIQSVHLTDERHKFDLVSPQGENFEFSIDHVKAQQTDAPGTAHGATAEFGQLEVELDHMGVTGSTNLRRLQGFAVGAKGFFGLGAFDGAGRDEFLGKLKRANLDLSIPPEFHGELDHQDESPLRQANKEVFAKTLSVFGKFRDHLFGPNWVSSGQKYAVAAAMLGLVQPPDYAPSVKRMVEEKTKRTDLSHPEMKSCLLNMGKLIDLPAVVKR